MRLQPNAALLQRPAGQFEFEIRREGTMSGNTVLDPQPRWQTPLNPVSVQPQFQQGSLGPLLICCK